MEGRNLCNHFGVKNAASLFQNYRKYCGTALKKVKKRYGTGTKKYRVQKYHDTPHH